MLKDAGIVTQYTYVEEKMIKAFTKEEYHEGIQIIIYGAGLYGELVFWQLRAIGIEPAFFADINHKVKEKLGHRVIRPEEICNISDAAVILSSLNGIESMIQKLKELHVSKFFSASDLLKGELGEFENRLSEHAKDLYTNRGRKYCFNIEHYNTDKFIVKNVDLVLTECCSLRCRDCGSLIPYYLKPRHIPVNEITEPFDRFIDAIDILYELRLLGGEPFLYPYLKDIISRYGKNERIKVITIFTNSTIVPSDEILQAIKDNDINIHISDYGEISTKTEQMSELCEKKGIRHYVHEYRAWRDMGDLSQRNYSTEAVKKMIKICDNKNCPSFFRGRLYVCPRAAHGEGVGAFVNLPDEYVDFRNEVNEEIIRKEIKTLLKQKDYFTACMYCNGNSIHAEPIEAAIQIKSNRGENN